MSYITGVCWVGPDMPFTMKPFRGFAKDRQEAEVRLRAAEANVEMIVWGDTYRTRFGYHAHRLFVQRPGRWFRGWVELQKIGIELLCDPSTSLGTKLNVVWYSTRWWLAAIAALVFAIKVL